MQQPRATPYAVEDLAVLPDDGQRYEIVHGWLVAEPPPGPRHGAIAAKLTWLLYDYVRRHPQIGVVLTCDTAFLLHRAPDTVRGPDVAFLCKERFDALAPNAKVVRGAPDLAVEVLSPGNRPPEVHAKVADYLAGGARVVWVIDPTRGVVTTYRELLAPSPLHGDDWLEAPDLLPGLRVSIDELFRLP